MSKKLSLVLALMIIASIMLAACGTPAAETPATEETVATEEAPVEVAATEAPVEPPTFKACEVTDFGGIDDKSFNATAWLGVTMAEEQLGIEGAYLESNQQTDYERNINEFVAAGDCNLIISVGFNLGDATSAAAAANPNQMFAIVDFGYSPEIPNVRGSGYQIDQATFLAGYLAAGMTQTGIVGTYGGLQIPPVTAFMDGFYLGVQYYNEMNGTSVQVIGWDPATQTGSFTGNFENLDDGRNITLGMLDEGADIIMPVAGPVGAGTLAALRERGTGYMIGVDTDWSLYYTDYQDIILASAMKHMENWVFATIQQVMDTGAVSDLSYLGTLENGGVDLVIGAGFVDTIPAEMTAALETIRAGIIDGSIATAPVAE